jgi:tRNA-2-methylthio-N6-dimethylallyladenosine synthase
MKKTASLVTFGCQMNVHDTQRMEELLRADGYELTDNPEHADVVVLNTCSVREKAEQKLRSEAGRLKRLDGFLIITGCVAQQEGEKLLKSMPYVDAVLGPDNLQDLPAILRDLEGGQPPIVRASFDTDAPQFLTNQVLSSQVATSAYVTTMKGCDERCSFCIVPYTRGPERYRAAAEIVQEVARLVAAGTREIVLLGQTVNSYQDPTVAKDPDDLERSQFAELLRRIAAEVPLLTRLRYTSPHPRHVTDALVAAHSELPVLAAHVHLPVQSGNDRVLKRMIRRYTRAEYVTRARKLLAAREGMTLSTDVIVGFPGETEAEFRDTLSLIDEVGFAGVFAFKYSPRPYTPALKLQDDIPEEVKQERLLALFELSEKQLRDRLASLVGTRQRVLIEGPSRSNERRWTGRTTQNEIVHCEHIDGAGPAVVATVLIERANKHSLEGVIESMDRAVKAEVHPTARRKVLPVVGADA